MLPIGMSSAAATSAYDGGGVAMRTRSNRWHCSERVASARQSAEMVQVVHLVREQMREDGSLRQLSVKWLGEDQATDPPPAVYGREPQGPCGRP